MMRFRTLSVHAFILFIVLILIFPLLNAQGHDDLEKVLGTWEVELDVEGEYFYLLMALDESEGKLSGTISESSGFFSDLPLSNIEYDGDSLNFDFTAPTPPDGMNRLLKMEFKVGEDKLEGMLIAEDLGITATAIATRKKE